MPPIIEGDRDDTPAASWYIHWDLPEPRTSWLRQNHQLRPLVRAYLACVSFVDSQVGRVLDAVDRSPQADNTIVVLWSDHGYHLGEKAISGKNSLWTQSTRVPLVFAGPGVVSGQQCDQPAELLDIYPTLCELAGGLSLMPQIKEPTTSRQRPAICTHNAGNHSVCDRRWRYIRYADNSEELYDRTKDPEELDNLLYGEAIDSTHRMVADQLAQWLPKSEKPLAPGSAHRILEKRGDDFYWQGKRIDPSARVE
jgi:arylsulfatase A-like enzyme